NIAEEASIAANLSGTTSEKTRLSVLSIVDDPDAELQQRESEQAQRANLSVKYETSRTGVTDDEAKPKEE
ncbi:MAG: phage portal protein, partial [Raoultibacter sp.]